MKKSIVCIGIVLGCLNVRASVVTNWVYVVSNIFNNVYTENVVTQKVKNTHYNYYYTNYVSVVTNVYQTTFKTNINMNVVFDNFGPWVNAASNAAVNASSYADNAAASSTAAASSASSASASASAASSAASDGLNRINERIDWFDQHSGETITNVNISTNIYIAEPSYIINKGSYIFDLNQMVMSVVGGKNIKLRIYANWSLYNYPARSGIGFVGASNIGGLSVHYGIGQDVNISGNNNVSLYIDDIYWTSDTNWNARVRWRLNNGSAHGSGYYRGAGPARPPNKYNPYSQYLEGYIQLSLVSQQASPASYTSYLGSSLYLWRASDDASTTDVLPVLSFVTDYDLRLSISSISNWVETVFQKK